MMRIGPKPRTRRELEAEIKWLREMNLALQAPLPPAEMVLGATANCAEIDAAQKKPQAGGQGV